MIANASNLMTPTGRYILPEFRERSANGERIHNPYTKLFEDRIIFLGTPISDDVANAVMAQLLCLESMNPDQDVPYIPTLPLDQGRSASHPITSAMSSSSVVEASLVASFMNSSAASESTTSSRSSSS